MTDHQTVTVECHVIAQSNQVRHVLAQKAGGQVFAVTPRTFQGDWHALRRGDFLELVVTCEPLPRVMSARLLGEDRERIVAVVLGLGHDTPYALVEDVLKQQFVVTPKVFRGDWGALKPGNRVELVVTGAQCGRVLTARIVDDPPEGCAVGCTAVGE